MNSMTGFGRAEKEGNGVTVTVELKSVNHRFLDMNIRMPRQVALLEGDVRQVIKQHLARGRVDAFINLNFEGEGTNAVEIDFDLVTSYLEAANALEKRFRIKNKLQMAEVLRLPEVMKYKKKEMTVEEIAPFLSEAVEGACLALQEARKKEGERIIVDILNRVDLLESFVSEIEAMEPKVIEDYREKLKARLSEYLQDTEIDENRFQAEILYFIDKSNITEETVRLRSHFAQIRELLQKEEANGRSLDFIVQELNREFNTIGSKSADIAITNIMIKAKAEVEKIREQVQNIE